jgi:type II secretory pathway pseudopilin PulG
MNIRYVQNNTQQAFTLIELMVATSIFIVVMLIALGSFVVASDSARKSHALAATMDNVSFAMEDMTRSIRVGKDYTCVSSGSISLGFSLVNNDCSLGGTGGGAIVFTSANHATGSHDMAFQLAGTGPYTLQQCTIAQGCINITSPEVNIETLKFFVDGSSVNDAKQPLVYITMKGTVLVKGQANSFSVQTIASQRSTE